ncbi:hypothetical protein OESDEN_22353 [Oesophagostomum dentatum]|uniref:Uncharacterized protein n=1 Tax=Oesophagostomum dentatum TaxID=61180 RepID=A0A0B1S3H8_OESDE|nr:hypothetical protein OESDEN_22353 [Oesophagostomum dentatum]
MDGTYSLTVACTGGVAICANLIFLLVFIRVHTKMLAIYKALFVYITVHDILAAICFALIAPKMIAGNSSYMFVAVGLISQWKYCNILLLIWSATFMVSAVLVANNLLFQYIQICKPYIFLEYGFDVRETPLIGFSLHTVNAGELAIFVEGLVLVVLLMCLSMYCAITVHFFLNQDSINEHVKKVHREMFIMLLVEVSA